MPDQNYFFIVGHPRSGTTLLSVLLDRHTRLCVPPETAFFDEVAPSLRWRGRARLMRVLGDWRRLSELNLEPEMVRQRLGESTRYGVGEVLAAILDLYAQRMGKRRCGEKTPQHLRHVPTILRHYPNARIICMLRDGRDASLSLNSMPWWGQGLAAAAKLWKRNVRLMDKFTRQYPTQFMTLRYEYLVTCPAEALSQVMNYLGEVFEPEQLRTETPSHVVLPRSRNWKGKALEPIDVGGVDYRRSEAPAKEIALLDRILGDVLHLYGYSPDQFTGRSGDDPSRK